MTSLLTACAFLCLWAYDWADRSDLWIVLMWFNLAIWAVERIRSAIRESR